MKTLIVSEGKHELTGALKTLVERLSPTQMRCEQDRVSRNDIHTHHGKGDRYFKRAIRWMLEARKRGFDALILVIDEDGHSERVREITKAQEYGEVLLRRALGVAIRAFDAWMLADERALTETLGYDVPQQANPETIADPKGVCGDLLCRSERAMQQRAMYAGVARTTDLGKLEIRCPRGFAPFAKRVRDL